MTQDRLAKKMYLIERLEAITAAEDKVAAKLEWVEFDSKPFAVQQMYQRWASLALRALSYENS